MAVHLMPQTLGCRLTPALQRVSLQGIRAFSLDAPSPNLVSSSQGMATRSAVVIAASDTMAMPPTLPSVISGTVTIIHSLGTHETMMKTTTLTTAARTATPAPAATMRLEATMATIFPTIKGEGDEDGRRA